jgi:hypothetical protein
VPLGKVGFCNFIKGANPKKYSRNPRIPHESIMIAAIRRRYENTVDTCFIVTS